jgi:hypothetical protein
MIRNGRGMMPSYNRIEERERWDIVNYIRGLQGALGAAVPTGPVAVPGFTGAALPGPSPLAPTRPAPHTPADMAAFGAPGDTVARDTTTGTATDTTRTGARTAPRGGDRQ